MRESKPRSSVVRAPQGGADAESGRELSTVDTTDVARVHGVFERADVRYYPGSGADPSFHFFALTTLQVGLYRTSTRSQVLVQGAAARGSASLVLLRPQGAPITSNGEAVDHHDLLVHGPGTEHALAGGPGVGYALLVAAEELERRLAHLLREDPPPIEGRRYRVRVGAGVAAALAQTYRDIILHSEAAADVSARRRLCDELEQAVVDRACVALADGWPPTQNAPMTLAKREALLKEALALVDERLARRIQLTDLCAELGVSVETLRLAFRELLGMPPMRYVHLERLRRCRTRLQTADPKRDSVKAMALDCGFRDLGRFALDYRRLFGESRNETLRGEPWRPQRGKRSDVCGPSRVV
jgi:AraC-like DNA-binding protein